MVMLNMPSIDGAKTTADIFLAAARDDQKMLLDALNQGRSLDEIDISSKFTPLMVAIISHSTNFLSVALNREFDPWIEDANYRTAFDHACALQKKDVMEVLYDRMYPNDTIQENIVTLKPK